MNRLVAVCLLLLPAFPLAARAQSNQTAAVTLTVSAAISLKNALEQIQTVFAAHQSNVTVTFNFGGSGSLEQQIEHGAPVDIFFSDGARQMDALDRQGLLFPGTRRNLLANHLVLIVPRDRMNVRGFAGLTKDDVKRIAMGEPESVPAGLYAEQTLAAFGLFDQLKPKLVYAGDDRQVLTDVETGDADAGFVYYTDARLSTAAKMIVAAPDNLHSPIVYPVAVIKSSPHPVQAKEFESFLASDEAREIFESQKFPVLDR